MRTNKRKKVLIVVMPVIGHINAVLNVAKTLSTAGHQIYFAGGIRENIDSYIEFQNFEVTTLRSIPFGLDFKDELCFYKWMGLSKKDLIYNRYFDLLFKERHEEYERVIKGLQIDHVFLDSFFGTDVLCMKNILSFEKISFINTMPITNDRESLPLTKYKLNAGKFMIKLFWARHDVMCFFNSLSEKIFLLGRSTNKIINRKIRELCLDHKYIFKDNGPISKTFDNIYEYNLSWPAFDKFSRKSIDHSHFRVFLGLQVGENINYSVPTDDLSILKKILKSDKIILVSFGSLSADNKNKLIINFIKRIITISQKFNDYKFIISYAKMHTNLSSSINDNVYLFDYVPQQIVLTRCRLFITHGGFNSIKESIENCVPMYVLPVNPHYDQNRNALNITKNNLGLSGNIENESSVAIVRKINKLLSDNSFLLNVTKLKSQLKENYSCAYLLNQLESKI